MATFILLSSLVFAAAESNGSAMFNPDSYDAGNIIRRDVAVIGGGASGTYGAVSLSDMGKSVVLVEKSDRLGGHENSYVDPATGTNVDYGVQAYSNTSVVRDFFARFNIPISAYEPGSATTVYADFKTGDVLSNFSVQPNISAYAAQLAKYPYLEYTWILPKPIPSDLLLPFGEFIKKYSLESTAFFLFDTPGGIANPQFLDQTTVNILKFVDQGFIDGIVNGNVATARHNNGELYSAAQAELGDDVLLKSTVVAASRPSDEADVYLVVKTPEGVKLIIASQVLISIPLTLANMEPFDLDATEKGLFSQFFYSAYYTGLFKNTGLPKDTHYVNVGADTMYNIPDLPGAYNIVPTAVDGLFYYWYGSPSSLSQSSIQTAMTALLGRLTGSTQTPEYVAFNSHTPFKLEVSAADIQNRFYDKLYALQGQRGLWYTGGTMNTQSSGDIWNFTKVLLPSIVDALEG